MTIRNKTFIGSLILLCLITIPGLFSIYNFHQSEAVFQVVNETQVPAVIQAARMQQGIQKSLSDLRGWMLLENKNFIKQRQESIKSINSAFAELSALLQNNNSYQDELLLIKKQLNQFSTIQLKIEKLSATEENIPATKKFNTDVIPQSTIIGTSIGRMIHRESRKHMGTEDAAKIKVSRQLLKSMADFRTSFASSLAAIQSFLLTGDEKYPKEFKKQWSKNSSSYGILSRAEFSSKQKKAFKKLVAARTIMEPVLQEVINIRSQPGWNQANNILAKEGIPAATTLIKLVDKMALSQINTMDQKNDKVHKHILQGKLMNWITMLVAIIVAIIGVIYILKTIVSRITKASRMINQIEQESDLSLRLCGDDDDELGVMVKSFNHMLDKFHHLIQNVYSSSEDLSDASITMQKSSTKSSEVMQKQQTETDKILQAITKMGTVCRSIADETATAADMVTTANKQTNSGLEVMNSSAKDIDELSKELSAVDNLTERLSEDIPVIDENT